MPPGNFLNINKLIKQTMLLKYQTQNYHSLMLNWLAPIGAMKWQNPDHTLLNFYKKVVTIRQMQPIHLLVKFTINRTKYLGLPLKSYRFKKKKPSSMKTIKTLKTSDAKFTLIQIINTCHFELCKAKQLYYKN